MVEEMKSIYGKTFARKISSFSTESKKIDEYSLSETPNKNRNIYHSQQKVKLNSKKSFREKQYIIAILVLYMAFSTSLSYCKKIGLSLINYQNSIKLIIRGKGDRYILSPKYGDYSPPQSVSLNGQNVVVINRTLFMEEENNTVILTWGETKLTSCYQMFEDLENIISIDFSNFDFSEVATIQSICQGCKSLKTLEFKDEIISKYIAKILNQLII